MLVEILPMILLYPGPGPPLALKHGLAIPNPRVLWVGVGRGCISSVLMVSPLPPWGVGWGGCRMEHKIAGA